MTELLLLDNRTENYPVNIRHDIIMIFSLAVLNGGLADPVWLLVLLTRAGNCRLTGTAVRHGF